MQPPLHGSVAPMRGMGDAGREGCFTEQIAAFACVDIPGSHNAFLKAFKDSSPLDS